MAQTNDGGPAFPRPPVWMGNGSERANQDYWYMQDGMTQRDYFAGQALAGLMANSNIEPAQVPGGESGLAELSYRIADAMLEARDA